MRRVTITIPDELERKLVEFQQSQDVPPAMAAIVVAALREYLDQRDPWSRRHYRPATEPLQITPIVPGSGKSDVSVNHDRYVAQATEPESVSRQWRCLV